MIEVIEVSGHKLVSMDGVVQSSIPPYKNGYWRQMIPDDFTPENALVLGLGAGTVCQELKGLFPDVDIEAVDRDKEMIKIAERNFNVRSFVSTIYKQDAHDFIVTLAPEKLYSLIIVDLFNGFDFSLKTATEVFLTACKQHLSEGGYLSLNMPSFDSLEKQFQTVKRSAYNKIYFYQKKTLLG